jgi:hypothetical protein
LRVGASSCRLKRAWPMDKTIKWRAMCRGIDFDSPFHNKPVYATLKSTAD